MIKNIVVWLVKTLKLEEVFLSEFKQQVRNKLIERVDTLNQVIKHIVSGSEIFRTLDNVSLLNGKLGNIASQSEKAYSSIHYLVQDMVKSMEDEIKELS